jgi:hypothetical protein
MKKIYIIPSLEVTRIEAQRIMAGSGLTMNGEGDVTGGQLIDEDAEGAGLSRSFEDWE